MRPRNEIERNVINCVDVAAFVERGCIASANQLVLTGATGDRSGAQAIRRMHALAAKLQEEDQDSPVIIALGDTPEAIEAYWAIVRSGRLAVPLPSGGELSLAEACALADAGAAVISADRLSAASAIPGLGGIIFGGSTDLPEGWADFELIANSGKKPSAVERGNEDACGLALVAGANGASPFAAIRTHRAAALTAAAGSLCLGVTTHRLVVCLPLDGRALETVAIGAPMLGVSVQIVPAGDADALTAVLLEGKTDWVLAEPEVASKVVPRVTGKVKPPRMPILIWGLFVSLHRMAQTVAQTAAIFEGVKDMMPQLVAGADIAGHVMGGYMNFAKEGHPWPTVDFAVSGPNGAVQHEEGSQGGLLIRTPQASVTTRNQSGNLLHPDGWLNIGVPGRLGKLGFEQDGTVAVSSTDGWTGSPTPESGARASALDVGGMMRRGARFHPQLTFLVDGEHRLSFAGTLARIDRLSAAISHKFGVKQGDRVGMIFHNRPEFIELYWAVVELGAVIVPINFRLQASEIGYILNDSGASLLFAEPEHEALFETLHAEASTLRNTVLLSKKFKEPSEYETLIAESTGAAPRPLIDEGDACSLLYTAGTTGFPKGAIRSHKAVMWYSLLGLQRQGPGDSYLAVPPMFHIGGQEVWIMVSAMRGGKIVLLGSFNPHEVLDAIERERISTAFIPPAIGIGILEALRERPRDLSSLRNWVSASAPLPEHVRNEAIAKIPGLRFSNGLGMTEAGGVAGLGGDDVLRKPSTCVGRPSPTVGVRIVDENDDDLPLGVTGEIVIRSPQIVNGYWNKAEATLEATRNGWFHTGDAGCFDEDGHLYVLDRVKDMVITGGENVYAAEVENVLFSIPEVLEAAIIGLPHPKWGEAVTAIVVTRPGQTMDEQTVITQCRNALAHYKAPRSVIFIEALPRNAMGKVLKRELRKTYGGSASFVPGAATQ